MQYSLQSLILHLERMVSKSLGVPSKRIFPIIGSTRFRIGYNTGIGTILFFVFFVFINLWVLLILVDIPSLATILTSSSRHETWVDFDCFQPLPQPILGDYKNWKNGSSANGKAPKIINVGFPKVGSTTLNDFLSKAQPYNLSNPKALVSHFWPCGVDTCGNCI